MFDKAEVWDLIVLEVLGGLIGLLLLFAVFTIICSYCISTRRQYTHNSKFYRFLLNFWTAFAVAILRIKIESEGMENIPKGRFLLLSNHRSNFDPIVTWYLFRKYDMAFISKEENFHVPFFGRIIRKCCFLAIDREDPRKALKTIIAATALLKKDEVSMCVYPEGTRNKTQETLLPFHDGVLKIAQKAAVPIVTIAVCGTKEIGKGYPWRSSKVRFKVVSVLDAEEVKAHTTNELGSRVRECLLEELEK